MRSRSAPDLAGRCPRCRLRLESCLCDQVQAVQPGVEIVVVRHALESLKSTNTARLAALALPSLRIVEYGAKDQPLDGWALVHEATCLLYPGPVQVPPSPAPTRLIVLDGSWSQARGMLTRVKAFHALPKLSVAAPQVAPLRARHAPRADQLTTIEAIAGALDALSLEGGEALRTLATLFAHRVLETRGRMPVHPSGS